MPSEEEVVEVPACGAMRCVLPPPSAPGAQPQPVASLPSDPAPLSNRTSADSRVCHGPSYLQIHARAEPSSQSHRLNALRCQPERRRLSGRRRLIRVPEESTPPPRGRILAECARWSTNDERAGGSPSLLVLRIQCRAARAEPGGWDAAISAVVRVSSALEQSVSMLGGLGHGLMRHARRSTLSQCAHQHSNCITFRDAMLPVGRGVSSLRTAQSMAVGSTGVVSVAYLPSERSGGSRNSQVSLWITTHNADVESRSERKHKRGASDPSASTNVVPCNGHVGNVGQLAELKCRSPGPPSSRRRWNRPATRARSEGRTAAQCEPARATSPSIIQ